MPRRQLITDISLLLFCTLAMLSFAWVGYLDSDDKNHLAGVFGWYYHAPFVAADHAELRHFIAIPIAISFKLFGIKELSVVLPNILNFALLMILTYVFCSRYFGRAVAAISSILIITLPIFAIRATVAYSDIVELLFIAASFWLFWSATGKQTQTTRLLLAGAAAGAAWLTRETTVSLLLLYGILFLLGYGIQRPRYWIMALGFFAIVLIDAGYYAWQTGNPLFRYQMILDAQTGFSDHGYSANGEIFDRTGNVRIIPGLDRLLVLLINHEFALLFFFAIPAGWWAWRSQELTVDEKALSRALIGLAVLWFLFVAIFLKNQHPRYFSVTTYAAAILCGLWFQRVLLPRYKLFGKLALTILVTTNLLAIYVDNKNPLFGERALTDYVTDSQQTVYTDPTTHRRAKMLLLFEGSENLVVSERAPPKNALYFLNPNRSQEARRRAQGTFAADPNWKQVSTVSSGRKLSGLILEKLGLREKLPESVYRRLNKPNMDVAFYQVTTSAKD